MKRIVLAALTVLFVVAVIGCSRWREILVKERADSDVVMWIGAHPDDEILVSGLLAKLSLERGKQTYAVSLTVEEKHEQNNIECVKLLGLKDYIKFDMEGMCRGMSQEECKPILIEEIRALLIEKNPSVVITFEPTIGFRGHPQHKLASRLVHQALVESGIDADLYYAINRDTNLSMLLGGPTDPLPYTDTLDLDGYSRKLGSTLWDIKLQVIEIYSDSVPNARILMENEDVRNSMLHKEFYRKVF